MKRKELEVEIKILRAELRETGVHPEDRASLEHELWILKQRLKALQRISH